MQKPTSTATSHQLSVILPYWENKVGILVVNTREDVGPGHLLEKGTLLITHGGYLPHSKITSILLGFVESRIAG